MAIPTTGAHYIAAIEALTPDDLRQAATACLDPQRANIALLLPTGTTARQRHGPRLVSAGAAAQHTPYAPGHDPYPGD